MVFVNAKTRESDIGVGHCDGVTRMAGPATLLDMGSEEFGCFARIGSAGANKINVRRAC